ncbi:MAG: protein kinase [Gemmatimonadaceae bacterium]|nr:protein kinase [Gemmatimonadaceae bacterium]
MTQTLRAQLETALGANFAIQRELGGGGMSRVFVADEVALRRRIVIKVLPPELAADVSMARFQREIALAARLQHPHIVPLLTTGSAEGLPYFTMPFVDGESLRDRITRGGELPVAESVRLLREIASALAYAHEQGIVHRDIKPENILLTGGIALVTDFGVAKALIDATTVGHRLVTAAGVAVGTPAYMSPEQVSADPAIDHRADLYAFGVVAYEMLAGRPPFAGRTTQALLAAHVVEAPEGVAVRRPAVPAALAALIMRCLEKRPADRPQSADEVVRELDVLATPTPTTTISRPNTPSSRRRLRWVAATLLLTAVTTATIWYARRVTSPARVAVSSRLLIAPFENLTGDSRFDHIGLIASDRLAQNIAQDGAIDVVPSNTVLLALRDTTGGQATRLQRLADATHAGLLVSGSVVLRGDSLVLQAQVSEVQTGRVVQTLVPSAGSTADPVGAVDALGDRLLGALGRRRDLSVLPEGFRAPKYAAYQEFAAGFERFATGGDNRGSRPFFERAIAIDSSYVQAYSLLIRQYLNAGEYARADTLQRKVDRLPGGLTAAERAQQDFGRAELEGNLANGLRAAQQLAARDSAGVPLYLVGEAANYLLQPRLAVPALLAAESTFALIGGQATRNFVREFAEALHQAGAHDRELQLWRTRESAFSDLAFVRGQRLRALAGLRQDAAAIAVADSLLRDTRDSNARAPSDVLLGALEFRVHGDSATSRRLLTMAGDWYKRAPSSAPSPSRLFYEGLTMLARGVADSAVARFTTIAHNAKDMDATGYLALSELARGNRNRARMIADSLGALHQPWLFGGHTYWRAAIVGALGDNDQAVQLLKLSTSEGRHMQQWHFAFELDALHGYAPFESLVRPAR